LSRKLTFLFIIILTGCVIAPPVQEMSDARQAIRSAEQAGAADHAQVQLLEARQFLRRAEISLESGAYGDARRFALSARYRAIQAREQANHKPVSTP